jgi:hypothetical protein
LHFAVDVELEEEEQQREKEEGARIQACQPLVD